MVNVSAKCDIVTDKGFCVAKHGDKGKAARDVVPYRKTNLGKVYVRFNGNTHGYWCDAARLAFPAGTDPETYKSQREFHDPYAESIPMPQDGSGEYHFGKNLRMYRLARRLSQVGLGEKMGKFGCAAAQATICYRERQRHSPNGGFVDAAAKALGVPTWAFFIDVHNTGVFDKARQFLVSLSSSVHTGV